MKGKKIINIILVLMILTMIVGCSYSGDKHDPNSALTPEGEIYRDQLTDEELEMDYIELELAEGIKLKGAITPKSKYIDGLNVYYSEYIESLTIDLSKEEWDNLILDKATEIMDIIENESQGKFDKSTLQIHTDYNKEYPMTGIDVSYVDVDVDVTTKELVAEFIIDDDKNVKVYSLDFNNFGYEYGEATSSQVNIADDIRECTPDYSDDALSFGSKTTGDIFYRTFIEELTGKKITEKSVCVPVNRKNYEEMKKYYLGEYDTPEAEEDFYHYYYYWQIDDFAVKRLFWGINPDELGDVDTSLVEDEGINQISLEGVGPSRVSYDADGVRHINILTGRNVGGVYKDKLPVVDINVILEKIIKYCEGNYTSKSIEIKNIELCYGQNITDISDGQLKKVWYPFWVVEYAVRPIYTTTCSMECVMYDACTGDRIMYSSVGLDE